MHNPVLNILSRIDAGSLPIVPQVLLDLIHATHKTDINFNDLSQIIGQDAGLSTKVLATANSSYYRQCGEITNLNRAITVLGLNIIKTIALTRCVHQFFSQIPKIHSDFLELIWYRSLTCAYLASKLARLTAYEYPDEAYLAGLLHRVGQLVLLKCFPKEYPEYLADNFDHQQAAAEQQTFGATQEEIGGFLIENWKISKTISDAVRYQSHPAETIINSTRLIEIINLSSQLARLEAIDKYHAFALADQLFGLKQPLLEQLHKEVQSSVEQWAACLGIVITNPDGSNIKCLTPKSKRRKTRQGLAEYIKQLSIASILKQEFEPSVEIMRLISTILLDTNALFGLQASALFLFQKETNCLLATSMDLEPHSPFPTLSVDIETDQSLLAKSLLSNQILHSFDKDQLVPETVVDRQIRLWLGKEGLLFMPLRANDKAVGLIVSGINRSELTPIKLQADFMILFAREAASALAKAQTAARSDWTAVAKTTIDYQLHARKLAHEANNPLAIINNYLYLLRLKLGEDHADEIRTIQEEIDRVSNIILRLPDATEQAAGEEQKFVNINTVIMDLVNLFRQGVFKTHGIDTVLKLDDALPEIATSQSKVKQILTNLLKNSAEAMPSGGALTISTQDQIQFKGGDYIEIQVSDSGPGLPEDYMAQLFKPVISTKGKGHSGLGLTICKNLVDELKGIIQYCSSSAQDTTFRILLPRKTK